MIKITKENQNVVEITIDTKIEKNCLISLINPTQEEISYIASITKFDVDVLNAPLDREESSRLEVHKNFTFLVFDVPLVIHETNSQIYSTIPYLVIFNQDYAVTICVEEVEIRNNIFKLFPNLKIKKHNELILSMLYAAFEKYLKFLKNINTASQSVQSSLRESMTNKDLFFLLDLQKSLLYFSTSLISFQPVLDRLSKLIDLSNVEEEKNLLNDVKIENNQAIEMCNVYQRILESTININATVISNNLNIVMKTLTIITILIAIPAMIAGIWGMNVIVPFASEPLGFLIVIGIALVFTTFALLFIRFYSNKIKVN